MDFKGLVTILSLFVIASGCNSTSVQYDIPEPFVDQTIYVSDPSSFNLTVVGGQLLLPNAGHAGILVYRRYFAVPFVSEQKRKEFLNDVKKTALRV